MNTVSPAAIEIEIAARSATSAKLPRVLFVRVRIGVRGSGRLLALASPRASV
jgi:hypothetical protein